MCSLTVNQTGQRFTCLLLESATPHQLPGIHVSDVSATGCLLSFLVGTFGIVVGGCKSSSGVGGAPGVTARCYKAPSPPGGATLCRPRTAQPPRWLRMSLQPSQSAVKPPLTKLPFFPRSDGPFSSLLFCGQLRFIKTSATSQAFPYVTPFGL